MKKTILFFAIGLLAVINSYAQPYLTVNNNSCADVFVDFYCREITTCAPPYVNTAGAVIPAGTTGVVFDAAAIYGSALPNHAWQYGLVGDPGSCAAIPPGGGCSGHLIQMTNGVCTGGGAVTSGCVNIDGGATGCQTGCPSPHSLTVNATFHLNGDADLDIN